MSARHIMPLETSARRAYLVRLRPAALAAWFFTVSLLTFMAVLLVWTAGHDDVCTDEVLHIPAGLSYAQKFDLRLNAEHPPLVKLLTGIVLNLRGVQQNYALPFWTLANQGRFHSTYFGQVGMGNWLFIHGYRPRQILPWARAPEVLIALLLAGSIFWVARRLAGLWAGIFCLTLAVSTPLFLAFGAKVLTDIPVALMVLVTLWRLGALWREPGSRNRALFAASFAIAVLTKYSAGLLLFCMAAFWISMRWPPKLSAAEATRDWRRIRVRATLRGILEAGVAVYLFDLLLGCKQPVPPRYFGQPLPAWLRHRFILPVYTNFEGMRIVWKFRRHAAYLFGHHFQHAEWFYYPILLLLKSTLGFVLVLLVAASLGVRRAVLSNNSTPLVPQQCRIQWRALWVGAAVFASICMFCVDDLAFRYFAPVVALLLVLVAPVVRAAGQLRRGRLLAQLGLAALAASSLASAARMAPYFIPYYNAFAAGTPSYLVAGDANSDFNQATPEVLAFAKQHQLRSLPFDFFGLSLDLHAIYPLIQLWDCQTPPVVGTRWVAVAAPFVAQYHNCIWLLHYPRQALGGGAVYAFHLPVSLPPAGAPGGPPLAAQMRHLVPDAPGSRQRLFRILQDLQLYRGKMTRKE